MRSLERLIRPRSIAFFGGSWARAALRQTVAMGFDGEIWPVHPSQEEIEGFPVYRSVADLPAPPDASFVGVNRDLSIAVIGDLARRGAGGAVAFASGFREAGADDLQDQLIAAAGDMPVIGPNCYGLINYCDGALLWPDQHGGQRLPDGARGAAIITQSSNIAINLTMQARGLPLSYVMTAGNQAQTGLSEIALGLIEDDRVSCLGLHIEGVDDPAAFERLALRARSLAKPIIAIKIGKSEQARSGTISHTASLAGGDAAAAAFLSRLGIARAAGIEEFLAMLSLAHAGGALHGNRLSGMSCSGGEASLVADCAVARDVCFPPVAPDHAARISATLNPLVAISNPLDYHTFIWNDRAAMAATFGAMIAGGYDLNLLVLDFPRSDRCSDADWRAAIDAFDDALRSHGARGAVVASLGETLPEHWAADILARGIAPLHGIDTALAAAEALAGLGAAWAGPAAPPILGPVPGPVPGAASTQIPDEAEAKARLHAAGIAVPDGRRLTPEDDGAGLRFPVAVKALGLAHKTEAGGVYLNIDAAGLPGAIRALSGLGAGVFAEEMITGGIAELMVGISLDPVLGPALTLASGGILVEVLDDSATVLLPCTQPEIARALCGLRLFPLLDGYRGRPAADIDALASSILAIAEFAAAHHGDLMELDINPLIVTPDGAIAADALLVLRGDQPS